MKNYEIAAMDKKELLSKIKELENRLADLNFYQAIEPAQNPMVFRNLKRDIARMKTRPRSTGRKKATPDSGCVSKQTGRITNGQRSNVKWS